MKNILLFDLETHGHHSSYIFYLTNYWKQNQVSGNLYVVVSPEFLTQYTEVVKVGYTSEASTIQFIPIEQGEAALLFPRNSAFLSMRRALQEWELLEKYSKQLSADHCLLLYVDRTHLPIILRRSLPCSFSSIYFRPTFHYYTFSDSQKPNWKTKIQSWREKLQILLGSKHPMGKTIFCLDPFAVDQINHLLDKPKAVYLPDPVPLPKAQAKDIIALKNRLGVDPKRIIFLLFGALDKRKGTYKILEALDLLSDHYLEQLCLLLVGKLSDTDRQPVYERVEQLKSSRPLQVILSDTFVSEEEVPQYFQLSNVILATYQRHVGMSGILVRAAAAGKPTICSNYGLMGETTRRHQLGLLVNAESSQNIAAAMSQCLDFRPEQFYDLRKVQTFAKANSVENFAATIFERICA